MYRHSAQGSAGRTLALCIAAVLVVLGAAGLPANAGAAPLAGRWEARGSGGARVTFVVVPAGKRDVVADVVVFCRMNGQAAFEDWSESIGPATTLIGPDGRITPLGGPEAIQGRLDQRSGVISSSASYAGGAGCSDSAYRGLRARHLGPVVARDGQWSWIGSLGSSGSMEVYGGGALIKVAGTFVGPPSPQAPQVGPCTPTLPGIFGPRFSLRTSRSGRFNASLVSGAFGYASSVRLRGGFAGPTRAAASYVGALAYPGYTCGSVGFIVATLRRPAPPYEPIYDPRTRRTSIQPRRPRPPRQRFPRSGPERNSFRCDLRRPSRPYDLCRAYPRREGDATRWVLLRHGARTWGFRHIQRRRGFSAKTDAYIAMTVARGSWDPASRRFERSYRGGGRACKFRVVDTGDPKGVITAYVVGPSRQGPVSLCPQRVG